MSERLTEACREFAGQLNGQLAPVKEVVETWERG